MNRALLLAAALTLLLAVLPLPAAHACTPPPGGHVESTPAQRTQAAEIVVLGEVTGVRTTQTGIPGEVAEVLVEQYLKGPGGPARLVVRGFGPTSVCLSPVQVGQRLIVYANGDPATGELRVNYLEAFSGVSPAAPAVIGEVLAAAGQEPVPPHRAPLPATPERAATAAMALTLTADAAPTGTAIPPQATPIPLETESTPAQPSPQEAFTSAAPFLVAACVCLGILALLAAAGLVLLRRRRRG